MRLCTVDRCDGGHVARGYCRMHYSRYYRGHRGVALDARTYRHEVITELAELGCSMWDIAGRLGVKPGSVERTLYRAGDHDLRARLARAS